MALKGVSLCCILLVFVLFAPLSVQSAEDVKIGGFVNDYANIISPQYNTQIESTLKSLYDSKTAEFSIVTIDSLGGQDIESYALNLAQGKLGDKEENNGLLLLVSVQDRKYRFEVGRGLEPILNDAKIGRIGRDYLAPNFKNEEYGKGIYEASLAVKTTILGETDSTYYIDERTIPQSYRSIQFFGVFIFWIVMFIIIVSARRGRHKRGKDNHFFDAALMAAFIFGGRGGRGGFGGGLGGGGFGGFGGGGFGGGGASGGW